MQMAEQMWVQNPHTGDFEQRDRCAIPGCDNMRCYRLESDKCYPHSQRPQDEVVKQLDRITDERGNGCPACSGTGFVDLAPIDAEGCETVIECPTCSDEAVAAREAEQSVQGVQDD